MGWDGMGKEGRRTEEHDEAYEPDDGGDGGEERAFVVAVGEVGRHEGY